jgi:hypothetical protein
MCHSHCYIAKSFEGFHRIQFFGENKRYIFKTDFDLLTKGIYFWWKPWWVCSKFCGGWLHYKEKYHMIATTCWEITPALSWSTNRRGIPGPIAAKLSSARTAEHTRLRYSSLMRLKYRHDFFGFLLWMQTIKTVELFNCLHHAGKPIVF